MLKQLEFTIQNPSVAEPCRTRGMIMPALIFALYNKSGINER